MVLGLLVVVAVTGCGRPLATQALPPAPAAPPDVRPAEASPADTMTRNRPIVLEAVSAVKLIGPDAEGQVLPEGIPDLTGLRIRLTPDGQVSLLTADETALKARTHLADDKVMFGVDLQDGATISGVLHVQKTLPLVAVLVLTDAQGRIFAGRQEFAPAGTWKPTPPAPEPAAEDTRKRRPTDVTGMLALADAFSGVAE
jgi:hypothetical protein